MKKWEKRALEIAQDIYDEDQKDTPVVLYYMNSKGLPYPKELQSFVGRPLVYSFDDYRTIDLLQNSELLLEVKPTFYANLKQALYDLVSEGVEGEHNIKFKPQPVGYTADFNWEKVNKINGDIKAIIQSNLSAKEDIDQLKSDSKLVWDELILDLSKCEIKYRNTSVSIQINHQSIKFLKLLIEKQGAIVPYPEIAFRLGITKELSTKLNYSAELQIIRRDLFAHIGNKVIVGYLRSLIKNQRGIGYQLLVK